MMRSYRALIVDDNAEIREIIQGNLAEIDFGTVHCTLVSDGAMALETVREQRFDLIISDEVMPHMSGTKFIKKLRELGVDTPVILISGLASRDLKSLDVDRSTVDVLPKPFDQQLFQEIVKAKLDTAA